MPLFLKLNKLQLLYIKQYRYCSRLGNERSHKRRVSHLAYLSLLVLAVLCYGKNNQLQAIILARKSVLQGHLATLVNTRLSCSHRRTIWVTILTGYNKYLVKMHSSKMQMKIYNWLDFPCLHFGSFIFRQQTSYKKYLWIWLFVFWFTQHEHGHHATWPRLVLTWTYLYTD